MIKNLGTDLLAIAYAFGTVMVLGVLAHQESRAKPGKAIPKPLSPTAKPQRTIAVAQATPRPIPAEQMSEVSATESQDKNTERKKRKTPEEQAALRAVWAEKRTRREEKMQKKAQRERQQQESV